MDEANEAQGISEREAAKFYGNAGEFLVLGELLKRKVEAYLALGRTQPDWDIGVSKPGRSTLLRVSVKSINWPTTNAVQIKHNDNFDVLVIALLNGEKPTIFLVIPNKDVSKLLDAKKVDRPGEVRTITVRANYQDPSSKPKNPDKEFKQYEHKWEHITA